MEEQKMAAAAALLSPKKEAPEPPVKPSPSKRQKIEDDENEIEIKIKQEPLEDNIKCEEDDDSGPEDTDDKTSVRRKAPSQLRVGDIFHMIHPQMRVGGRDFTGTNGSFPREIDPVVLARRFKQIEYGKSTAEYKQYTDAIAREERLPQHPRTPNMNRKYSRRAWDGLIRLWRCSLHLWDQDPQEAARVLRARRQHQTESCSSTGESTSTSSSVFGDGEGSFMSEEDPDHTVLEFKVKVEEEGATSSPAGQQTSTPNRSWYEETLEFENDYLDLYAPEGDEFEVKVKSEVKRQD